MPIGDRHLLAKRVPTRTPLLVSSHLGFHTFWVKVISLFFTFTCLDWSCFPPSIYDSRAHLHWRGGSCFVIYFVVHVNVLVYSRSMWDAPFIVNIAHCNTSQHSKSLSFKPSVALIVRFRRLYL
jgi:hypothetical protein